MHAVVLRIHFPLARIGFPAHEFLTTLATPARQKADARARLGFIVDDEIGVVTELAFAAWAHKGRKLETAGELNQHFLKRLALTTGWQHRNAYRINQCIKLGNRPVQHRHHIVTF